MDIKKQFEEGLLSKNPVLVQLLGMCSTLAITTSLFNGIGMGISVISHTETPGLGAVAADAGPKGEAFRSQFVGGTTFTVGENVDAMSGATITSKAVTTGVNAAVEFVENLG